MLEILVLPAIMALLLTWVWLMMRSSEQRYPSWFGIPHCPKCRVARCYGTPCANEVKGGKE